MRFRHLLILILSVILFGCGRDDMADQPKYKTLGASEFFADGQASRPIPAGTVARGQLRTDEHLYAGRVNGQVTDAFPMPLTLDLLERGRQRYDIYCAVCHGATGDGNGMIVQRGFTRPPSFHIERLRTAPAGHYFDVITNGWGAMFSYNDRVNAPDRWAITAYIRALQLSQNAPVSLLPTSVHEKLPGATTQENRP